MNSRKYSESTSPQFILYLSPESQHTPINSYRYRVQAQVIFLKAYRYHQSVIQTVEFIVGQIGGFFILLNNYQYFSIYDNNGKRYYFHKPGFILFVIDRIVRFRSIPEKFITKIFYKSFFNCIFLPFICCENLVQRHILGS